jgi:hypothetical protein
LERWRQKWLWGIKPKRQGGLRVAGCLLIRLRTLHMLLSEWLESKLSWFIITVSWWRSLSLILIIVIIDILLILYVKVFIKLGNTPFEHFEQFSRHCYIIWKVIKFNYTLFALQKIWNWGLVAYSMTWILRHGEIRFWDICSLQFLILICAPFGFEFYLWFIKKRNWNREFDCTYSRSCFDMLWNVVLEYAFLKGLILICTRFGFWFGLNSDLLWIISSRFSIEFWWYVFWNKFRYVVKYGFSIVF